MFLPEKGGGSEGVGGFSEKMNTTLEVVELVRRYKSESQISMGAELSKLIITATHDQIKAMQQFEDDLKGVTKTQTIEWEE